MKKLLFGLLALIVLSLPLIAAQSGGGLSSGGVISGNLSVTGNTSIGGTLGVTGTTTLGLANITTGSITALGAGNVSITGNTTMEGLWLNTLTAGRVAYVGTAGLLSDDADLTFDGTTLTAGALNVTGNTILSGNLTVNGTETIVNSTTVNVTVEAINPGPTIGTALSFNPLAGWTADYLEAKDSGGNTLVEIDNSGNIHSTASITADATVSGLSVTDGTATLTGGVLSGLTSLTSTTVTDGVATLTAGSVTGLVNLNSSGSIEANNVGVNTKLYVGNLTSGRVPYVDTDKGIIDSANLAFDGTALTAANITDSSITAGRVVYGGTAGDLTDNANVTVTAGGNLNVLSSIEANVLGAISITSPSINASETTANTIGTDSLTTFYGDGSNLSGIGGTGFVTLGADNALTGTNSFGGLTMFTTQESTADDGTISLPASVAGFGFVQAGDNEEYTQFSFTTAGVVTLINSSTNVINTDTDNNLCVYDGGSNIIIKNRLGGVKTLRLDIKYSN